MSWDYAAERGYLEDKGAWGEQPDEQPTPALPIDLTVFAPLGPWAADAACAVPDVDPTLFDAPSDDDGLTRPERAMRQKAAAAVCASCPVRAECLADADENGLTGVRGGVLIFDRGLRRKNLLDPPAAA